MEKLGKGIDLWVHDWFSYKRQGTVLWLHAFSKTVWLYSRNTCIKVCVLGEGRGAEGGEGRGGGQSWWNNVLRPTHVIMQTKIVALQKKRDNSCALYESAWSKMICSKTTSSANIPYIPGIMYITAWYHQLPYNVMCVCVCVHMRLCARTCWSKCEIHF